jgi:allophanate hydrolase subunit 2
MPAASRTPDRFRPPITSRWAIRVCRSAETHRLADGQRGALFDSNWIIGRRADRMGLQLEGPSMDVESDGRMASAPVFPGTLQCPEDGVPFLLGVDAQTTGGYPRIAQIARADRHLLGQMRPGDHLRFLPRQPQDAIDELRAKCAYWRSWLPEIDSVL